MTNAQQSQGHIDSADLNADLADEPLDRSMETVLYCCNLDVPAELSA